MRVDDNIKKCVAFLGYQLADGTFKFAGSAFWIGRDDTDPKPGYLVTARHVIDGIKSKGLVDIWLRLNHIGGQSRWFQTSASKWFVHPSDASIDVAILNAVPPDNFDHLLFPIREFVTPELIEQNEIGPGDEVFVVGLFRHHHGNQRNIPIIRVGSIASMFEERIEVEDFGPMEASLIEARSIGGLSGSPVFIHLGGTRYVGGTVRFEQGRKHHLFGLIHGHFDVRSSKVDQTSTDELANSVDHVNTGIAIVVPYQSIEAVVIEFEKLHGN